MSLHQPQLPRLTPWGCIENHVMKSAFIPIDTDIGIRILAFQAAPKQYGAIFRILRLLEPLGARKQFLSQTRNMQCCLAPVNTTVHGSACLAQFITITKLTCAPLSTCLCYEQQTTHMHVLQPQQINTRTGFWTIKRRLTYCEQYHIVRRSSSLSNQLIVLIQLVRTALSFQQPPREITFTPQPSVESQSVPIKSLLNKDALSSPSQLSSTYNYVWSNAVKTYHNELDYSDLMCTHETIPRLQQLPQISLSFPLNFVRTFVTTKPNFRDTSQSLKRQSFTDSQSPQKW